jgi:peptidoglycan/LPS O-acetylase OafA/YrhL
MGSQTSFSSAKVMVILLGFGGILATFLLANGVKATFIENALAWCGIASLGIFVLHAYVQRIVRIIFWKITSTHAILPNVLIPFLFAVLVPGLLWHFRKQLHIGFVFECPWGAQKTSALPPQEELAS